MSRYLNEPGLTDGLLITDTNAATGNWCAIQIVENTVFTTLTGTITVQGGLAGETLIAGSIIYGNFTEIKLASGAVIAYNAR
jgi:hypothetical protein